MYKCVDDGVLKVAVLYLFGKDIYPNQDARLIRTPALFHVLLFFLPRLATEYLTGIYLIYIQVDYVGCIVRKGYTMLLTLLPVFLYSRSEEGGMLIEQVFVHFMFLLLRSNSKGCNSTGEAGCELAKPKRAIFCYILLGDSTTFFEPTYTYEGLQAFLIARKREVEELIGRELASC
jgi:hypothetical protein